MTTALWIFGGIFTFLAVLWAVMVIAIALDEKRRGNDQVQR